jgi:hypothetical protein
MMRFFKQRPNPTLDRESSPGVECAVCAEDRVELINGWCASCILDEMGAKLGNDVPRKFSPRSHEPRSRNGVGRRWAS